MATAAKSKTRPSAGSGRTGRRVSFTSLVLLLAGALILGGAIGFAMGWKKHTHHQQLPFPGTISRVALDGYSVCVTPSSGGADICDPLYQRAGGKAPAVGDSGWFNYSYGTDDRGVGYQLLVETRNK